MVVAVAVAVDTNDGPVTTMMMITIIMVVLQKSFPDKKTIRHYNLQLVDNKNPALLIKEGSATEVINANTVTKVKVVIQVIEE